MEVTTELRLCGARAEQERSLLDLRFALARYMNIPVSETTAELVYCQVGNKITKS